MSKRSHDSNLDSEQSASKKNCKLCSLSFQTNWNLDVHMQRKHTRDFQMKCEKCDLGFSRIDRLKNHILNRHKHLSCKHCGEQFIGKIALQRHEHFICEQCGHQFINKISFKNHMRKHRKSNIEKITTRVAEDEVTAKEVLEEDENSQESAFNKTLLTKTWRIRGSKDPLTLMSGYKERLKHYLTSLLIQNPRKFYIVMEITMVKKDRTGTYQRGSTYFCASTRTILRSVQINEMLEESSQQINTAFENFTQRGSGWILESIDYLKVHSAIYNPIQGKTYVPTPKSITKKNAIINIKNDDERCFEYAIVASQHFDKIDEKSSPRPQQYSGWMVGEKRFNFDGCSQPMNLENISKFEKNNNLAINVYHIKSNGTLISPLRITEKEVRLEEYVNLLLIEHQDRCHYTWIRNFDRLLSYTNKAHKFCLFCCRGFDGRYKKKLLEHLPLCRKYGGQKVIIPPKGKNIVQFNDLHKW